MAVWLTSAILFAQKVSKLAKVLTILGQIASCVIHALYSLKYMPQLCLMRLRPILNHYVAHTTIVGGASEKAKDEDIKSIGRMTVGGHPLTICFAIIGRHLTILVDKPEEVIDVDVVGFTEALQLK
jgi:hypothetical protein